MAAEASPPPQRNAGTDHRLEQWLFPELRGWPRGIALYLYYLAVIVLLLLIYGRGDFTTAPFVYQGF